jgi:stearoyl-CoA desaturase (delta-9 desaturase)
MPSPAATALLDPSRPRRVHAGLVAGVAAYHALALLAAIPWLFTWSGLALAVCGNFVFGMLGVNVGYHRLLTHRSFAVPRAVERVLAVLGACCLQGTPMAWVAVHRKHHRHAEQDADPHSPRDGFLWSHIGWFLTSDRAVFDAWTCEQYAPELFADRFYRRLERPGFRAAVHAVQWSTFVGSGLLAGVFSAGSGPGALRLALSWLVWGVCVRVVLVWHVTLSVNSIGHLWGYRSFDTPDDSRNNVLLGLLASGEGWHNNHHADPRSAAHGHRSWEVDLSYAAIRLMAAAGLARDVVRPRERAAPDRNAPDAPAC